MTDVREVAGGRASATDIEAVLFDYGGVLSESPFQAFTLYESKHSLPAGFIRSLNAANHHENAWARLERNEIGFEEFCEAFEAEAAAAGGSVDALELFSMFTGALRPEMVEAVRRCHEQFKTGLLTNNFMKTSAPLPDADDGPQVSALFEMFDAVVASSEVGIRKPDSRFYALACQMLGVAPEHAVFLDDLGVNLKPARAMGMITIKVEDPGVALSDLESVLGISLR
jgi:putative hydrolase of the HAD superfamily